MSMYEICFSPTGGTKKAADILTKALQDEIQTVDLADSSVNFSDISLMESDVAVIAVPSYGGRVPETAVSRLLKIKGNGAKAVLLCVYGNRAYEDTLMELLDSAKEAGFRVAAAVCAIAEHSIARQIAAGRPYAKDQKTLQHFAEQIRAKLDADDPSEPAVPGSRPYKKSSGGMVPKPTKDCVACGLCAAKCPVQAIDKQNPAAVDSKACISCMRCVAVCPHSARKVNGVMLAAVHTMLKKVYSDRKECELFL